MRKSIFIILAFFFLAEGLSAQENAKIMGIVRDSLGIPVDLANVALEGSNIGTMTDSRGNYLLEVPANEQITLIISCVGFETQRFSFDIGSGLTQSVPVILKQDVKSLAAVSVSARQDRASTFNRIDVRNLDYMPSTSGKVEALIISQAGVSSNNELSSQYSVRGGNFDENLVYVNDIEIYRPFLVRSGQQEGLSFVNSDLVSSIRFSAGAFDARYGDKMSSALDIRYRTPTKFAGSASISLLGASAHLEGISKNKKLSYITGYRYKTTSYLLNSLETSGDYKPQFSDFQGMINYRFSDKAKLSFLGNYSSNNYNFVPSRRDTEFGTHEIPFNLTIYYDGQEIDRFDTYLGALSLELDPVENLHLSFNATAFQTREEETFDIRGEYLINELDNTAGSETYGDSILNIGIGTFHDHARNYLDAYVFAGSHLGTWTVGKQMIKWGLKYQYQYFFDRISEWNLIDSSGYLVPAEDELVSMVDFLRTENNINYDIISGFLQDTWEINASNFDMFLTFGSRATVWNYNKTLMFSPRATISFQPHWNRDMMFHISGGTYYQPPFYKELRMPDGLINKDIRPQKSTHLLAGGDYIFSAWDRPFKITAEAYYKWLDDLIPYKIDNVRIKYAGENIASGYAYGLDLKLNGEFVPGAESWFTVSVMQTKEDIEGDSIKERINGEEVYVDAGYYSRPTEQLFTTGVYFQDYLPNSPDYKVTLSAFYGTSLPLSQPAVDQYYTEFKMRPYRRVDVGFSKVLKRENQAIAATNPFRHFTSIWISGEIFNLLGINNQASTTWIRTVSNQAGIPSQFAVPNYLTGRRFNIKLAMKF